MPLTEFKVRPTTTHLHVLHGPSTLPHNTALLKSTLHLIELLWIDCVSILMLLLPVPCTLHGLTHH